MPCDTVQVSAETCFCICTSLPITNADHTHTWDGEGSHHAVCSDLRSCLPVTRRYAARASRENFLVSE